MPFKAIQVNKRLFEQDAPGSFLAVQVDAEGDKGSTLMFGATPSGLDVHGCGTERLALDALKGRLLRLVDLIDEYLKSNP